MPSRILSRLTKPAKGLQDRNDKIELPAHENPDS